MNRSRRPISFKAQAGARRLRRVHLTTLAFYFLVAGLASSQILVVPDGDLLTVASCNGVLLDPGGTGDYSGSQSGGILLYPDRAGAVIELELEILAIDGASQIEVYAGEASGAPLTTTFNGILGLGEKIVATSVDGGALTVIFDAGGASAEGFQFRIRCEAASPIKMGDNRVRSALEPGFTDSGGFKGPYGPNESLVTTLRGGRGEDDLLVFFNSVIIEPGIDQLDVYEGPSTGGTSLGSVSVGTQLFLSSNPAMTFEFNSDATVEGAGWDASIQAYIRLNASPPGALFRFDPWLFISDSGGPAGSYEANENIEMSLTTQDQNVDLGLDVAALNLGSGDTLRVFGGSTTAAPLLGTFQAADPTGPILSAPGSSSLTIQFESDSSGHGDFVLLQREMVAMHQNRDVTRCSLRVTDSGGDSGAYGDGETATLVLRPQNPVAWMEIEFGYFDLEDGFDFLAIYDGTSIDAPLLGMFSGTSLPPRISASPVAGGALTLQFASDGSFTRPGFLAFAECTFSLFEDGFESGGTTAWSSVSP